MHKYLSSNFDNFTPQFANLVCIITLSQYQFLGNPEPRMTWKTHLPTTDVYTRVSVSQYQAVMSMGHVTRDLAGNYTCVADNGYQSEPTMKTVQLQVHCK